MNRLAAPAVVLFTLCASHLISAESGEFGEEDFTRKDRAQILYTPKLSFNTDNIPVVNILVTEGNDEIEFSSRGGFALMPEGETGTQVIYPAGTRCKAKISSGSPAVISYYPVCGKAASSDFERISALKKTVEDKGKKWRSFNLGSVFGFYGTVLDNRVTLIAFDLPSKERGAAEKAVEELKKVFDCDFSIYEDLTERPGGTIAVRCGGEPLVRAQDVIFVSSEQKQFIKVHGVQFAKGYSWEGSEDREYRGQIYIAVDRNGKLAAVNSIDAESLLRGLVPSEIYK
ncbi:MAG: hypothetical protein FJ088_01205, partial [Deltaproteobacteria bacterium]|nr:hypothetical protein [Deltaproteobacteria bacterium]